MLTRSVAIYVSGRVQGVFYRDSARNKAIEFGIAGSARNLADGRVELFAQGSSEAVDAFLEWCSKGPPNARVDHVEVNVAPPLPNGPFKVIR